MNETPIQAPTAEEVKRMSFTDKLTDVFASPGELFDNVRLSGPTTSNWLIPLLITMVVAIALSLLVSSNASLSDQLGATIKQSFEKQVQAGKMTQDQADQIYEKYSRPGSTMFTIQQIGAVVIFTPLFLFAAGLVYWLLGKLVMKAGSPYLKVVEVIGLALFITILESIVTTGMMIAFDSIHATPSLGAFISDYSIQNKMHLLATSVNVFTFWSLGVVSIGLSRLFQKDLPKVAVLVVALWVLWTLVNVFLLSSLRG